MEDVARCHSCGFHIVAKRPAISFTTEEQGLVTVCVNCLVELYCQSYIDVQNYELHLMEE